jgi:glycosyltransferase involved in cell wall biosynthesis
MTAALRMLMLLTDGFGGVGGIAKFNRDFLQALDACDLVERVQALPRLIPEPIKKRAIPEGVIYDRRAAGGKAAFMRRVGAHLCRASRLDLVLCGHINLLPAAWLLARLRGARLVLIIYGTEAWERPRDPLKRQLAGAVDAYISISRFSAERFNSWSKIPIERIFILPCCVDLNYFQPEQRDVTLVERYGLQTQRVILTVGRLASEERKGFDQVIEAMPLLLKQVSNLKYLIVGDGPDRSRLEAKVTALRLSDHVIFAGYISESEKAAHYNLADVYVMPSVGEGFGIVLIEAAACGIPVVGSQSDGSREALLDGQLGRLVDPKKPDELIQAVASFLERAPLRKRIDGIECFNTQKFKARVSDWCRAEVGTMHQRLLG